MWCERVVRRVADPENHPWGSTAVDYVDVAWNACGRVLKSATRAGVAVRVLLPPRQRLHHGDVIFEAPCSAIVIHVPPCEVIVARPPNATAAARLALELGNLHWPTQVTDAGELLFIEDGPPLAAVEALAIPWTREQRRFEPTPVSVADVQVFEQFQIIRATLPPVTADTPPGNRSQSA
jgi:urease accessory protein UreE